MKGSQQNPILTATIEALMVETHNTLAYALIDTEAGTVPLFEKKTLSMLPEYTVRGLVTLHMTNTMVSQHHAGPLTPGDRSAMLKYLKRLHNLESIFVWI
jgi:hypothetical protein